VKNAIGSLEETAAGTERRLSIEVATLGRAVQVMFSDTGPGFADPNRAFDPFFTTRQQGDGVGLGLSICYSIIREHGGEISAVNLHPQGAAVVIELPAEDVEANARGRAEAQKGQLHAVTAEGSWNSGIDAG
jgi:C4-dicarboxylate-specific signal transduction histidine kinase